MKLYVMRHCDAGPRRTEPQEERWRGLTPEGREHVRALARQMLRDGEEPKAIYASNYNRTQETADIVGQILGCPVNLVDELAPHMAFGEFIDALLDDDNAKKCMVVGHSDNIEPWLEENGNTAEAREGLGMGEIRKLDVDRVDSKFDELWRLSPEDVYDADDEEDAAE